MDKLARVQDDIDGATSMMRQNLEAVVDRGQQLELLVEKSDAFDKTARAFQKESKGLRRAMWWRNVRMVFAFALMVLIIFIAYLWKRCGLTFAECRSSSTLTINATTTQQRDLPRCDA